MGLHSVSVSLAVACITLCVKYLVCAFCIFCVSDTSAVNKHRPVRVHIGVSNCSSVCHLLNLLDTQARRRKLNSNESASLTSQMSGDVEIANAGIHSTPPPPCSQSLGFINRPMSGVLWWACLSVCAVIPVAGQRTHGTTFPALKVTSHSQVTTPGAESVVYDCVVTIEMTRTPLTS